MCSGGMQGQSDPWGYRSRLASFSGLRTAFDFTKEREGPGMFPHMCDVEGRKVVERT